jgi:hypothetical protein
VALEELSLFGDFDKLPDRIRQLPPSLAELFQQVLGRLEHDHGRETSEVICRWLAASRSGLLVICSLEGEADKPPRWHPDRLPTGAIPPEQWPDPEWEKAREARRAPVDWPSCRIT